MKWENNINNDLREVDYTEDDWITLAPDRDVWRAYVRSAMNLRLAYLSFHQKFPDILSCFTVSLLDILDIGSVSVQMSFSIL
ncbi:hypothetical protein C0J52_19248 [Blattella germanica]|nr:hypothetical protein C0J52_19248 [Blattella germanica]